jgi:3-oxoacyl-[acyl-carrier-protein] synthase-3
VLTALELLDGFVRSGTIQTGMVVASDCEPGECDSFPFPAVGGAILVRPTHGGEGFVDLGAFAVVERWLDVRAKLGVSGRAPIICTLKGKPLASDPASTIPAPRDGRQP